MRHSMRDLVHFSCRSVTRVQIVHSRQNHVLNVGFAVPYCPPNSCFKISEQSVFCSWCVIIISYKQIFGSFIGFWFTQISHLLVWLRLVGLLCLSLRKQSKPFENLIKALDTASITAFAKLVPQLGKTKLWIAPLHTTYEDAWTCQQEIQLFRPNVLSRNRCTNGFCYISLLLDLRHIFLNILLRDIPSFTWILCGNFILGNLAISQFFFLLFVQYLL